MLTGYHASRVATCFLDRFTINRDLHDMIVDNPSNLPNQGEGILEKTPVERKLLNRMIRKFEGSASSLRHCINQAIRTPVQDSGRHGLTLNMLELESSQIM